jgi:Putative transposase
MSGTSSLCLRCAKVSVDNWVSQVSQALHAGGISRHILRTVPALFRTICYQNAAVVLRAFMRCGAPGLDDFSSTVRGKTLQGGSSTVLHTHGRHGPSHPPLPVLATRGGDDKPGERWEHRQYVPYELLRRQWQWPLLTRRRQTLPTKAIEPWVDACCQKSPDGLVTNVQQGHVPAQSQSVARYVATDVVSPPIAVRRIDRYEGRQVTYHSRSHRTERMEYDTVPVDTFIGRMVQHVRPKGCKRIRYDGVQATKTFAKVKIRIQTAWAKVEEVVKGAVKILARLTSRQRYEQSTGRDPVRCPHCLREMELWCLWHPTYGVIYVRRESAR